MIMSFRIRYVSKCANRLYQLIPLSKTWSYSEWGQQTYSKEIPLPLKEMCLTRLCTICIPNLQLAPHEHTMKSSKWQIMC